MRAIKRLLKSNSQLHWIQELFLLSPRLLAGLWLATMFGGDKFGVPWSIADTGLGLFEVVDWFPEDVAQFGGVFSMAPEFFAWCGAASEAIGGLLLALGLLTRPAALMVSITMLTAIFFQKWGQGLWNMLPAISFLWVGMYHLVHGSGRFGLDHLLLKWWNKKTRVTASSGILKTQFACLFLIVGVAAHSQIIGNGNIISETFKTNDIEQLDVHITTDIKIVPSDEYYIRITAEENIIPNIKLTTKKDRLIIDQQEWIEPTKNVSIIIGSNTIDEINLDAWATIDYKEVAVEELEINAEVGTINLEGSTNYFELTIKQATINAALLKATHVEVKAEGHSNIHLYPINSLDIKNEKNKAKITLANEPRKKTIKPLLTNSGNDEAYYKNADFIEFKIKNNSWNRHHFYVIGPKKDGTTFSYGFPMMPGKIRNENWSVGTKIYKESMMGTRKLLVEIQADDEGSTIDLFN